MAKKELKTRFVDNNNGTISDTETGFMWQKQGSEERLNFKEAEKYCKTSKVGEHKDWRLPTLKELTSIVDYEKYNPAIDPIFNCKSDYYWTSTPYVGGSDGSWVVYFLGGYVNWSYSYGSSCVRPVRQY